MSTIDELVPDYTKKLPPPPPNPSLIKVLEGGRQRVKHGWVQGSGYRGSQVCAAFAMSLAQIDVATQGGGQLVLDPANRIFLDAANDRFPRPDGRIWHHIPEFNDERGRTQADVLDVFDHALKLAGKD